jgi:hypothetical protein
LLAAATAVTEYTVLIPQILPQKDTALFGVVRLDKSKKVHNQKQLECGCNIGAKPNFAKAYGRLAPNLTENYTLINVYQFIYKNHKNPIPTPSAPTTIANPHQSSLTKTQTHIPITTSQPLTKRALIYFR